MREQPYPKRIEGRVSFFLKYKKGLTSYLRDRKPRARNSSALSKEDRELYEGILGGVRGSHENA